MMKILLGFVIAMTMWGADASLSLKEFQSPPDSFRPIPFWAWTGDMHREQIHRQLRLMRDQRLMSAMIYPRYGLEVPYFSEEFMGLVRYTVEQAQELGMTVWLYDEYTWPSGTVGKRIPREHPRFRSAALCVFQHYLAQSDTRRRVELRLPPDVFKAFAVSADGQKLALEVTPGVPLRWTAPPGAWRVQVFWVYRADDYVDTLNPEAIRMFIDTTYEGYRKVVGKWFGSVVKGIFTDEPVMFHRAPAKFDEYDVKAFPWTDRMPAEFRSDHGYDLMERLPELLGEGVVRRDLWTTGTRLYSNSFHRQIGEWCRRNGIAYTGHILDEEPASSLVRVEGDYFSNVQWMGVPGIDEVWTKAGFGGDYPKKKMSAYNTTDNVQPGEWVAPKMVQSTAESIGSQRTLIEAYALGPPSITLNEMRRMVNWEAVLGVNTFLIAVHPASLRGSTISTGWLPALFYQQPWYRLYTGYSDYVARTSYMLTRGERISSVGVVYPSVSCWGNPNLRGELDKPLKELTRLLLQSHKDFTFVFESGLDRTKGRKFDALYVPPLRTIEPALAKYLKEFGGPVYFYERRPEGFSGGEVIGRESLPQTGDLSITSPRILAQRRKAGDATILFLVNVSTERTEATITIPGEGRMEFWDATTGEVAPATNPVHRTFEPGEGVFVVVRQGTSQPVKAESSPRVVEVKGPWRFRAARENSLRLKDWALTEKGRFETAVEVEYLPAKLELSLSQDLVERVWVNGQAASWEHAGSRYLDDHNREIDVTSFMRRGRNVISIESVHGREFPYLFYGYLIGDFSVNSHRIVAPVRKVSAAWTAEGYPEYSGTGIYSKTIDGVEGHVELELANVAMDPVEVYINGQQAGTRLWEPYRFDLTGKLKPGSNRLEIRVTNSAANMMFGPLPAGLLGPVKLLIDRGK
ncbi:MAG: glycosyl hydrolase [Bryobacteraceae bacterium]